LEQFVFIEKVIGPAIILQDDEFIFPFSATNNRYIPLCEAEADGML
jgi:hypothetical protein